jgi:hypothetical protein
MRMEIILLRGESHEFSKRVGGGVSCYKGAHSIE